MFSVWAPHAKSVDLVAGERRVPLQKSRGGHWAAEPEGLDLRVGYRYSIDGGDPLPDPRSEWQPDGVHGSSHRSGLPTRSVRSFRAKPLREAVIYEMHVGTFTPQGTYAAARGRLAHLAALGITHVELMPLATFPGDHGWGYDGVDLFAPFPAYGTPRELYDFIEACHAAGIAVLLDVVYNHLGPDGNYLGQFGPFFTDRYKTGWGAAINYDGPHSDAVREFVIDNALMWLRDYGFDGLRLDAVHAIFSFEAMHVLEELSQAVAKLGEELDCKFVLIAESDLNDPRLVRTVARGGLGLDAQWCDDFHHAVHRQFTGEVSGYYADFDGLRDLAAALRDGYVYQGQYSVHRGRRHGRRPTGVGADQLIVCAQNHDQVGNRALGERLSMLLDTPALKALAALTLLSPFVPMLFQGEEWGAHTPFLYFTDHQDHELGRLVAEGRAREFSSFDWQGVVPNPQQPDTFARSKLNWAELNSAPHAELFEWHRQLVKLRAEKIARTAGRRLSRPVVKFNAKKGWLTVVHGGVLSVLNLTPESQRIALPPGAWHLGLDSASNEVSEAPPDMGPHSTRIYVADGASV